MKEVFLKRDGVSIAVNHYQNGYDDVIIICPGWFMTKDSHAFKMLAETLSDYCDVIVMDFRGHGRSGGMYTFTAKEQLDIEQVVTYAKSLYNRIFIMGFSLGAGLSLIYAAEHSDAAGVIAVSPYTNFYKIENGMWHPNAWIPTIFKKFEPLRWISIRPGYPFYKKINPIDIVNKITVPVLFIAGSKDKTIYSWHTKALFDKAVCRKHFELFENGIHAEDLFMDDEKRFINVCISWINDYSS